MTDARTRLVADRIEASVAVHRDLLDPELCALVADVAGAIAESLRRGGKLVLFGNGGSAADAQHIAAELVGRYLRDRAALPALALTDNSSILTAVANDYGYDHVFKRQVEAVCRAGDVALALSTSGDSPNVVAGVEAARTAGARTVGLTGAGGGHLLELCDVCIRVPSDDTPRIQEAHALIGHVLCEIVEDELGGR
ncbi:MAG: D-sedoheptulose 7-phosphate isomerase [Thermoleophilaceae bacterium]|nr:D-sedoheptulose 7-phosphate isomerase [Thermoleophilaceae bacterium]